MPRPKPRAPACTGRPISLFNCHLFFFIGDSPDVPRAEPTIGDSAARDREGWRETLGPLTAGPSTGIPQETMENTPEPRFEDPAKLSQADLAPPSEHELLQQHHQSRFSSMEGGDTERSGNPPQGSGEEEPSTASQQVRLAVPSLQSRSQGFLPLFSSFTLEKRRRVSVLNFSQRGSLVHSARIAHRRSTVALRLSSSSDVLFAESRLASSVRLAHSLPMRRFSTTP